jgi:hypothetical protein
VGNAPAEESQDSLLTPARSLLSANGGMMLNRYCVHKKQKYESLVFFVRLMATVIFDRFILAYPHSPIAGALLVFSKLTIEEIRNHSANRPGFQDIDIAPLEKFRHRDLCLEFFEAVFECIKINCGLSWGIPGHALSFEAPFVDETVKQIRKDVVALHDIFVSKRVEYPKWLPVPKVPIEESDPDEDWRDVYRSLVLKKRKKPVPESIWLQEANASENCAKGGRSVQF